MKLIRIILLSFVLAALSSLEAADYDRSKRREATEKELTTLQTQIKKLQSNQAKKRSSLTKEQKALQQTDVLIGKSRKSLKNNSRQLTRSRSRISALKVQRKKLSQAKNSQQKALREQIRAAYAGGKQEYLKLLFNQQDPSKLGRTLVYYDYLNKARLEKIQALNSTLEKLLQVEIKIISEQQQLITLEAELKQENTRLALLKTQRKQAISELSRVLKSNSKRLKEWQENELDLISLLQALKQTVATLIPEESLDGLSHFEGKLNWPVKGVIRESFGSPRGDVQTLWSGMLIAAKEGQAVNAIHHGRIVYSDYLRGFGLITIIDHGGGYMSLYGHNEALYKQPGDWIEAGEQIATVGQSGGYPTIGLYFEIRFHSKALNPENFIGGG